MKFRSLDAELAGMTRICLRYALCLKAGPSYLYLPWAPLLVVAALA
jgi:hypothetical protein